MDMTELKRKAREQVKPLVLALDRMGASPLGVSLVGLAITALAGWLVAQGQLFFGAIVFAVGSGFDMLDGDLARLQGTVSKRGAFLDSCFDRLGEAFLFAGLTWYFASLEEGPDRVALVLVLVTTVGSLTTSYVRARAEGVGETCQVGFLQRTERVILLTLGLLLGRWILVPILWFLAVATLATTVQRIVHVAGKLPGPGPRIPPEPEPAPEPAPDPAPESEPAPPAAEPQEDPAGPADEVAEPESRDPEGTS